jgi:5-methylcytosine-specific restriction endonuclease McrA
MAKARVRKSGRQFEKDRKAFFARCRAEHRVCWLCGMPIDYEAGQNTSDDSYNLDHLYPVSKRPDLQHDPAGFRPSHTSCNRLRGNKDPAQPLGMLTRQWILDDRE